MKRKEIITSLIDRLGVGLEIGPSHDPVAPKAAGYNVRVVDHLSQGELKAKYEGHGVNTDNIESVDVIWRGEALEDLLGEERYDWIIASHVIEHMPDPIKFIRSCQKVLKENGILSLAIPDKRFCLDHFRPPSSTGQILDAYLEGQTRHTPGQVFDAFSFAARLDGVTSWNPESRGHVDFLHAHGLAGVKLEEYLQSSEYVDVHGWVFTPSSFRLAIGDLTALGYLTIREALFVPTVGCEFFVSLSNSPPLDLPNRLKLAELACNEAFQASGPAKARAADHGMLARCRSFVRQVRGDVRDPHQR